MKSPTAMNALHGTANRALRSRVMAEMSEAPLTDEPQRVHAFRVSLGILELHVLVGRPDRHRHQIDRMVGDARSDPNHHSRAPDWREHHAVDRELLNAVEQDLALGSIPLSRLLLEQLVDVRVAAIGVTSLRVDERLHARGRIPGIPRGCEKEPSELLLLPRGIER